MQLTNNDSIPQTLITTVMETPARLTDEAQTWALGLDVAYTNTLDLLSDLHFALWARGLERWLWATTGRAPAAHLGPRAMAVIAEFRRRGAPGLTDLAGATLRRPAPPPKPAPTRRPSQPISQGPAAHPWAITDLWEVDRG